MKNFVKLIKIFLIMELRNKQAFYMNILFPILLMTLMGFAGNSQSRNGISYMAYILPGILAMAYGGIGLIGLPVMITSYKERNILKKVATTPISMIKFFVAIFITQVLFMVIQTIIIILASVLVFNVKLHINFFYGCILILLLLISSLSILGAGFIICLFSSNAKNATTMGNLANLIMMFLGGAFFSTTIWPQFLQPIIKISPMTNIIEVIRRILIFQNETKSALITQFILLSVFAIATISIGAKKFNYN